MAILKPFGYSSTRSLLQICSFWCWLALSGMLHYFMMWRTKKINRELEAAAAIEEGDKNLTLEDTADRNSPVTSEADEEAARE